MNIEVLWDGTYGLSSLSEKTRKSNRLQMSLQRQHFLLSYLKTLSVGPAGVRTHDLPHGSPVLNQLSQPVGGISKTYLSHERQRQKLLALKFELTHKYSASKSQHCQINKKSELRGGCATKDTTLLRVAVQPKTPLFWGWGIGMLAETIIYFVVWLVLFDHGSLEHFPK